jgi:mannitol-1-phosphate 5-dehydrogenase
MNATIIGAGSIGRGFLGQLFAEARAAITFIELDETIVAALEARRGYDIRVVADDTTLFHVPVAHAVGARDVEAAARAIADAHVAATAVGVTALPAVAEIIARAVELRVQQDRAPLNVVVCENVLHSGQYLASLVDDKLPATLRLRLGQAVGFAAAVVSRMVPVPTEAQRRADPLAISVEPYCILPVDATAFLGDRPAVPGFRYADNIVALEEQKAYTHNAGHCMLAYLGYQAGHTFIWQAAADGPVRRTVEGALDETSRALVQRHGFDPVEQRRHVEDLFGRYANRALGDTVARVARDPMRKLRPDGRLIGSAYLALEYGISPDHIVQGVVAALRYDNPDDAQAVELQSLIRAKGIRAVLRQCCGLGDNDRLMGDIESRYLRATKGAAT